MSGLPLPSATSGIWSRGPGPTINGPSMADSMFGSGPIGLPTVNNSNLPLSTMPNTGNLTSSNPQPLFSSPQQTFGPSNSFMSNNYPLAPNLPPGNPFAANLAQNIQNEANDRRLMQLEDENTLRRNTTSTIQNMGANVLQGQMEVQDQVLKYQAMLDQCMDSLDHQNFILNEQAEELSILRGKMRHFEYFLDTLKYSKAHNPSRSRSGDFNFMDNNMFCFRNPSSSNIQSTSPFFTGGGVTRTMSSKFQPFNQRHRSSNQNDFRSMTPSIPNSTPFNTLFSNPISHY